MDYYNTGAAATRKAADRPTLYYYEHTQQSIQPKRKKNNFTLNLELA
jgi:hypothetical protein